MARKSSTGKGASGLSSSAGGGSSRQAQSGGKNTTFGGGKGGTKLTKNVTKGASRGSNVNGAGLDYTIRSSGGDKTLDPASFRVGGTPPQTSGGLQKPIQSMRSVRPPTVAGSS
jgi:hypothetical protein